MSTNHGQRPRKFMHARLKSTTNAGGTTNDSVAYAGEDSLGDTKPRNSMFTESTSFFTSGLDAIKVEDCKKK
jgi:hypothetical protein